MGRATWRSTCLPILSSSWARHASYADSSSPGPRARCTRNAASTTAAAVTSFCFEMFSAIPSYSSCRFGEFDCTATALRTLRCVRCVVVVNLCFRCVRRVALVSLICTATALRALRCVRRVVAVQLCIASTTRVTSVSVMLAKRGRQRTSRLIFVALGRFSGAAPRQASYIGNSLISGWK